MNLFEIFPELTSSTAPALRGRALRLIGLSALAYDERAFYFELAHQRFWVSPPATGTLTIGVGGAQCPMPSLQSPVSALVRHLRKEWGSKSDYFPTGQAYLLEDGALTVLPGATLTEPNLPYLLLLTPPRLGGGDEVPDALVQAVYLLRLRRPPSAEKVAGLLRVDHTALEEFLGQELWPLEALLARPWAALDAPRPLPQTATLRLVLALRGLRELWQSGYRPALSPGGAPLNLPQELN